MIRQEMIIGQFIQQALLYLHFHRILPGTQCGDIIALIAQMRKLTAENWCDLPRARQLFLRSSLLGLRIHQN